MRNDKFKSIINVLVSVLTAFLTALGTTSCNIDIRPSPPDPGVSPAVCADIQPSYTDVL